MSGVLYLLALLVVPWLVAWMVIEPSRSSKIWWPFDMKGEAQAPRPGRWAARGQPDAWRNRAGRAALPPPPGRSRP